MLQVSKIVIIKWVWINSNLVRVELVARKVTGIIKVNKIIIEKEKN